MLRRFFVFLILVSLVAGYSESLSQLRADPINCPQYECKNVHAWWEGSKDFVIATHVKKDGANSDEAMQDIWTDTSIQKNLPGVAVPFLEIEYYKYPACTPICGKDAAGRWVAVQQVIRGGAKGAKIGGSFRSECQSNGGQEGPKLDATVNVNLKGNTPPGN